MNTIKRVGSVLLGSCIFFSTVLSTESAIADTIPQPPSGGQILDDFIVTKALSSRLGVVDLNDDQQNVLIPSEAISLPEEIFFDQPPSFQSDLPISLNAAISAQLTIEPVFSERTANHLSLGGQSQSDSSRKRLALGDFDNNGSEDIIVSRWTNSAQLFLNNGGILTFSNSLFSDQSDLSNTRHAGVLDANDDGWLDLILRNKILFNLGEDGSGNWQGFGSGQTISGAETNPFTIQTADFDGDGDVDAVTSPGSRMLVNNGAGTLISTPSRMGSTILTNVIKFDARDLDGDGDIDLAGPEVSEQNHFAYYNNGNGVFSDLLRLSLPIDTLTYTQIGADFNGDSIADFRIYADGQLPRAFMSTGTFNGSFPQYNKRIDEDLFGDNGKHGLVHIRDIDGDGDLDYILSSLELFIDRVDSLNEKTEIIVNKDLNSGEFEVFADPEYRDEESFDAKIVDINLDGNMDLFIAHQGRLAVYINDAPPQTLEITSQTNVASEVNTGTSFEINVTTSASTHSTTWDFGDGTTADTGNVFSVNHVYTEPGRYLVTATVSNGITSDSLVFRHTVFETQAQFRPNTSTTIVYESGVTGGDRVWSVNPDHNSISAVNIDTNIIMAEISVGTNPTSLAFAGDGKLYVVNKDDGTISVINTSTLSVESTFSQLPPASQPHAIVFNPSANSMLAYVTLEATGQLAEIDFSSLNFEIEDIGPFPRELSTNADGSLVYVSRFITGLVPGEDTRFVSTTGGGEVWIVDTNTLTISDTITLAFNDKPDTETSSRGVPNYLMAPIVSPSGLNAFVPANVSNIYRGQFRDGQNREHNKLVRSMLAKLDLQTKLEDLSERHDFDNSAQPTAGTFDPTGNYLYLVFEASRKLRVYDVYAGEVLDNLDVGFAPRGVTVSPDGTRVIVDNYLSRSIHVFNATEFVNGDGVDHDLLAETGKTSSEPLSSSLLLGKQLFFDAADERLSAQSYISCATCHADGGHDGRTWDFSDVGEGLRNTIDLRGRAGTAHGLVHWSGNFDEIQDFENDIRDIFQGTGLMTDADFANTASTLGTNKAGLSTDLDALAEFLGSLGTFGSSPYRMDSGDKTPEAISGEQVFTNANCTSCHSGNTFSDSIVGDQFHDIGTVDTDTGGRLGGPLQDGGLDTPTLKGLWNGAPYLHDGSSPTVKDAVLAHTASTVGFDVNSLTTLELDNLEAYLLQLGDSDIPNLAPIADAGLDQSLVDADDSGNEIVNLDGSNSSDFDDGVIVDYVWSSDTGVLIPDGETVNASFPIGTHTVTLTITDNKGITATDTVNITVVEAPNLVPIANAGTEQSVADNDDNGVESVTLDASASIDDDGSISSYIWESDTATVIPNGVNSTADFPIGVHNIILTITDNEGAISTDTTIVTVTAFPNIAPIANASADQTIVDLDNTDDELVNLTAALSTDNDGSIDSYVWSSDSGVVIPDGVTSTATFPIGFHNITLTVTDNEGAIATDTVLIIVNAAPNEGPVADAGTDQSLVDVDNSGSELVLLDGSASTDNDGTISNYSWSSDTGVVISGGITNTASFPIGTHTVILTITDNDGSIASDTVVITVTQGPNIAPIAHAGADQSLVDTDNSGVELVTLNGSSSSDSDGTIENYAWSSNTGVVIANSVNPTASFPVGVHTVTLTVTDNGGETSTDIVIITVTETPNIVPVASAGVDQSLVDTDNSGAESVTLNGSLSSDSDGTIENYSWSSDTGVVIANSVNPTANFTVGIHTVTLTVIDDDGASATDTVVISITEAPNVGPSADAGIDQTVVDIDNSGLETLTLIGTASTDADGSIVSHAWSSDTGVAINEGETSTANFPVGVHIVTLTVTDNDGATATDITIVTVIEAPNNPPVMNNPGAQLASIGDTVSLSIVASDNDGNTLSFSQVGLPSGLNIDANSGEITGTPVLMGIFSSTITVSDEDGASASVNFEWTIEQGGIVCTKYDSTNIPIALPNQVASITSSLSINSNAIISDVNVNLDMTHDWIGDLSFTLTHQNSDTSVVLMNRPGVPGSTYGCRENDILVILDDDATNNMETTCNTTAPTLNGNFSPFQALADFNQLSAGGEWVLKVDDGYVGADAGTLRSWSIEICAGNAPANQPPIANAGIDQSAFDINNSGTSSIQLDASESSDTDGTITSYVWTSDTGVIVPNGETVTVNFPVGVHTVTLTTTDDYGASATDIVLITVNPPLVVSPDDQQNLIGDTVNLELISNVPNPNDSLTFSQIGLPTGLSMDNLTGQITGTVTTAGSFNTIVSVTSSSGDTASISFDWLVQGGSVCNTYNSGDIPVSLPNQVATISSNLVISNTVGAITDVNVFVDMRHDWVGDLSFTLTSQSNNQSVVLMDQPGVPASNYGCSRNNILATFDDDATRNTETTCAGGSTTLNGEFKPTAVLSSFNQQSANGTWVLKIDDDYIGADAGELRKLVGRNLYTVIDRSDISTDNFLRKLNTDVIDI